MKRIFRVLFSMGFLFPTLGWAMALGDLKLESALNEPFKAIIPIEEPGAVQDEEITVNLAPTQINDAVTHYQQAILSDLRFKVVNENNGRLHIEIQSEEPVNEPFLQLPVMMSWPAGELLRDYTVMLDPILAANTANTVNTLAPVQPALPENKPAESNPSTPINPTTLNEKPVLKSTPAPALKTSAVLPKTTQTVFAKKTTYGPTRQQDRLWQIASRYQETSRHTSVQQWAFAIYSINQDAFIKGNINQLKSQVYLQVPSLQVVMTHSKEETKKWMNDQEQIPTGG